MATEVPTYYDRPTVKPAEWRWLIVTYLFVGGLAGAAQVIASIADLVGHRRNRHLVSAGRSLALLGALLSPVLLIADLKARSRWFNMLRVFRGTSPMSIGSWTLVVFGGFSGLAWLGQIGGDVFEWRRARLLARWSGVPAAFAGGLFATYTGALLAATSTPVWTVAYRWLPALFGLSGTATACAALRLVLGRVSADRSTRHRVDLLSLIVGVTELGVLRTLDRQWSRHEVRSPFDGTSMGISYRVGVMGLGVIVPVVVHVIQLVSRRDLPGLSAVAALAALAGGYAQRVAIIMAGKHSAENAHEYLQITQPDQRLKTWI
jgi:formate-dependent nitrite reductase membrane component NrfD